MKKSLLVLTIFIAVQTFFGQSSFNRAYHAMHERAGQFIVNINGDLYFSTGMLYKHNSNGVLKFSVPMDFRPSHGFKTLDGKLLMAGVSKGCGTPLPTSQINYITKRDTNGNAIFTATATVPFLDDPKAVLQYSDSSYFLFTDSVLYKYSKTGQFVSKTNLGLSSISGALLLQNNTILTSAKSGNVTSLVVISASGAIVTTKIFPFLMNMLSFYGGQKIIGRGSDGKLHKISTNLDLIGSSSFVSGSNANGFVCHSDTLYTIYNELPQVANYAVTDTAFNTISLTSTNTHSLIQAAICLNSSKVAILSNALANTNTLPGEQSYFASLNVINKMTSNNFANDLELISVTADSAYLGYCSTPPPAAYCETYLRVKAVVKNSGVNPVTEFKLNCVMYPGQLDCPANFYQEKFSQLSIQPGNSATVTSLVFLNKKAGVGAGSIVSPYYCFYTSVPNGETDKTLADNQFCSSFNFIATSLKELNAETIISVFPNPFETKLNIESDSDIKKVQLFNSLGVLIYESTLVGKNSNLDFGELSAGIYFVKIETEKGTAVKKVVKN